MLHELGGKFIQIMHTTMVPVQVKILKIQAGVQVSRPGELRRHLRLWKRFRRHYFIVIVLVRSILWYMGSRVKEIGNNEDGNNNNGSMKTVSDYVRALIEMPFENVPVDSLVMAISFNDGPGHTMETIDVEYKWQPSRCATCKTFGRNNDQCPKKTKVVGPHQVPGDGLVEGASTPVSNAISALEEDNGKPMDALIDDTGKKVEVHYFDMDDMKFDDMRHAIEEAEYENAYSENG
ncbi:hypothetical protein Tco_1571132 [Tanacetum coccineum]